MWGFSVSDSVSVASVGRVGPPLNSGPSRPQRSGPCLGFRGTVIIYVHESSTAIRTQFLQMLFVTNFVVKVEAGPQQAAPIATMDATCRRDEKHVTAAGMSESPR